MADDDAPGAPQPEVPAARSRVKRSPRARRPAKALSAAQERAARVDMVRELLARGYAPSQVMAWLEQPGQLPSGKRKDWVVNRTTARAYLDHALEGLSAEVAAPKDRKQARTRAMLTLIVQKALALADGHPAKAAGLLNAAVAAADKIARIDGSYAFDASVAGGPRITPGSVDEAIRIVNHANATMQLALKRGALKPGAPIPPPVIDVSATEVEPDGEDAAEELTREPAGGAN